MHNGTIEASFEQSKHAPKVVNRDEVTSETMHIQLFCYKEEPLVLDDGTPFLDEKGKQRVGRVSAGTRTAKIKNIAPIDMYTQALGIFDQLEGAQLSSINKEQLESITDLILQCWQISEPFMTKEMLREGIDGLRLIELFTRFFNRENPQSNASPSADGNITHAKG